MRVLFKEKSFHTRIIWPGEIVDMPADTPIAAHMIVLDEPEQAAEPLPADENVTQGAEDQPS